MTTCTCAMNDSPPLLAVHCDDEEGGGRNEEEVPPKSEPPSKRPKLDHNKEDVTTAAPRTGDKNNAYFLKEVDVGVTEYLTDRPGIFAILKQRYSDFVVREIAADGCVARLTSYEIPQEQEQDKASSELSSLLSAVDQNKLTQLVESNDTSQQVEIQAPESKSRRTEIHTAIRCLYPALDSTTATSGDGRIIKVFYKQQKGADSRTNWPQHRGNYLRCVLYKENTDTIQAVQALSGMLRVKSSVLQYSGTKDRRAITSQYITAYRVTAQRLLATNGANSGFRVGNFEYVATPMKLGNHHGNHFTIVLRNITSDVPEISASVQALKDNGFINYFGMQRFGTSVIPTHHIGRALLHSKWQEAVDLILNPRDGEPEEIHKARQHYCETKDIDSTLKMLSWKKRCSIEVQLLKGLKKYGAKNCLAALLFLPRNTRTMYVHSYQSYIWNKMASARLRELGQQPAVGDLVFVKRGKPRKEPSVGGQDSSGDKQEMDRYEEEEEEEETNEVELVTEENLHEYLLSDVVLPLPGFSVKYPKNCAGKKCLAILSEDGFSPEKLRHRVKDFALPGNYRKLIVKPGDVNWEVIRYNDVTIPLTQSDVEILEGRPGVTDLADGKLTALKLEFSLPLSTYATMALRELMKLDTSPHYQTSLNAFSGEALVNADEEMEEKASDEGNCVGVEMMTVRIMN